MKKIFLTDILILVLVLVLLLMPWNINLARSGCNEFLSRPVCNNSLIMIPNRISENSAPATAQGLFPFDDLIIKI